MKTVKIDGKEISVEALKNAGYGKVRPKPWEPTEGDLGWILTAMNGAEIAYGIYDIDETKDHHKQGLSFETKEKALAYKIKREATTTVLRRLRELEGDWVADWDNTLPDKCVVTSDSEGLVIYSAQSVARCPYEWYSTRKAWQQVLEEMPENVRLMFGERK